MVRVGDDRPRYMVRVSAPDNSGRMVEVQAHMKRAAALNLAETAAKRHRAVWVHVETSNGSLVSVARWQNGKRVK